MSELTQNCNKIVFKNDVKVSSMLFLDIICTNICNCMCKFCIARTKDYAKEDFQRWKENLKKVFQVFPVKSVILLGGEATIDPLFFQKLEILQQITQESPVDDIILTTNGIALQDANFIKRLANYGVTQVNMSVMHYDYKVNQSIMGKLVPDHVAVEQIYHKLKEYGIGMRINTNVWKHNLDTPPEMQKFVDTFTQKCDAIKFSPLMMTSMFDTAQDVLDFTTENALSKNKITRLYHQFANCYVRRSHVKMSKLVDYEEINVNGQTVILKYAQIEDKYNPQQYIPTLKIYPNGNVSNLWDYKDDIFKRMCLNVD